MNKQNDFSDLKVKSVRGIKWQVSTEIVARVIQLLITITLARLLLPSDFGLIGMALIFTQLAYVLFDMGLSTALIQKKNPEKAHYRTAFTVFIGMAIVFYSLIFFLAPLFAEFFKNPVLKPILRWLALIFFFYALRAVPTVKLTRGMRFKALGVIQFFSVLVYGSIAVILALRGEGVWSFVFGIIGQESVLTLLSILAAGKIYLPGWNSEKLRELISFGSQVLGTRIIGYLNVNLPNLIIGRWLGTTALGFYSVGYQLVDFPVQRISKNVLRVMFPAFSKIQDEQQQYRQLYKDTLKGLSLVIFPVFAGMVLVAPEFVRIFYGTKWEALIPVLQILTVVGWSRSLWTISSVVFLSKGKPKIELIINLIYFSFLTLGLLLFYSKGLIAVITVMSVLIFLFVIVTVVATLKLIKLSFKEWAELLKIPLTGTLSFSLAIVILRLWVFPSFNPVLRLSLIILISVAMYIFIVVRFDPVAVERFKKVIKPKS
ncbi:MAG: lipopolysaccharide biosynthesis protein [Calditrichaeota bacterium]|nr:lipopolysaccharide biosynthesis protein [Calditrichota bacterium]